jgi:hypothetical protein
MGLDMYLRARCYIATWNNKNKAQLEAINAAIPNRGDIQFNQLLGEAAYWRKANHIHKWFVDNVQDGQDDCGTYHVSREQLTELRNVCQQVLDDRDQACDLLPTRDGFFFGGTDYDEYYWDSLEYTVEQLDKLLDPKYDDFDFEYQSSW